MNIITCLVLNRPYNISQVFFDHLVDNIRGEKYIMYPRFIQMKIDDQVNDLPKDPANVLGLRHMTAETLGRLTTYKGLKKDESKPRARRMICNIANPRYVAPNNNAWRHENNNSENEDDSLRDMHEKKLRYWFVKDEERKRTPKTSPAVSAPKVSTPKIVVKGIVEMGIRLSKESPPRLVDEPVLNPADVIQQGVGLMKESLEGFLKKNEEVAAAKSVQAESVKEKEPKGVDHTDSSDADDESIETKSEIEKIGVGKVTLKKKPLKKKRKDSDDEDESYIPTPQAEKKTLRKKHKAVQSRVIPSSASAKKGGATMSKDQGGKSEKHNVEKRAGDDDDDVVITDERASTPPPPPPPPKRQPIPQDAETSKPKKTILLDPFECFPNVRGEFTDDILPDEDYDMFHDATIKDLKKKVSLLEKEKAKAEADHDELKKQLE
ncbi:hypothetical protein Hanom_Chr09g00815481 [Helianthus anomalus]